MTSPCLVDEEIIARMTRALRSLAACELDDAGSRRDAYEKVAGLRVADIYRLDAEARRVEALRRHAMRASH